MNSKTLLNLSEADLRAKVSGMAGDGAFCKENKPFKDKMRALFGKSFKFRWDLLHLVNRAHLEALENHLNVKELLDFVQSHSSTMRSGIEYTSLYISDLIGFKRPKIRSETRMVNFEYDQLDRFFEKYFDHPQSKVLTALLYVFVTLATKIILQEAQKTSYSSDFIEFIFLKQGGKTIMLNILDVFVS